MNGDRRGRVESPQSDRPLRFSSSPATGPPPASRPRSRARSGADGARPPARSQMR